MSSVIKAREADEAGNHLRLRERLMQLGRVAPAEVCSEPIISAGSRLREAESLWHPKSTLRVRSR